MIYLNHISKKFGNHWIFKGLTYTFKSPDTYAVLGHNGVGKSTLLRIIAGMQNATTGKCIYRINDREIKPENLFRYLSYCAPGMDLVEELTLFELLHFHFSFKPIQQGVTINDIIQKLHFETVRNKYIHEFSSGMKQRVKLAQAFFSDTPILLLDEPCSNLDEAGLKLYDDLIDGFSKNRLILIASNDAREYRTAQFVLRLDNTLKTA